MNGELNNQSGATPPSHSEISTTSLCECAEMLSEAELTTICEGIIKETAEALLCDDFERFTSNFIIPMKIETFQGTRYVRTREEHRAMFRNVVQYYKDNDVTDLVRVSVAFAQVASDEINLTYQNMIMSRSVLVQKSFPTFTQLKRIDNRWKFADSQYAVVDSTAHQRALGGTLKAAAGHDTDWHTGDET